MTGALAGLLIDFQFYAAATSANMGSQGNANFFANFYILLNFSSLLLQLFATPTIQDKVGLRGGLMVLPLALIGGATFATAAATALGLSVPRR
jgi:ATP/ADP translocase